MSFLEHDRIQSESERRVWMRGVGSRSNYWRTGYKYKETCKGHSWDKWDSKRTLAETDESYPTSLKEETKQRTNLAFVAPCEHAISLSFCLLSAANLKSPLFSILNVWAAVGTPLNYLVRNFGAVFTSTWILKGAFLRFYYSQTEREVQSTALFIQLYA